MPQLEFLYVYFCLDSMDRDAVAAFGEFREPNTDQRIIRRVRFSSENGGRVEWESVVGVPDELTSHAYDIYKMTFQPDQKPNKYDVESALKLFQKGKLDEEYLEYCANFIAHR